MNQPTHTHLFRSRDWIAGLCGLALLLILTGCSSGYAIEGRVVRGPFAAVLVVSGDDPRLSEPNNTGGGAVIRATLEPNTPTETKDLGKHVTNGEGYFAIPVDAFGSGLLEYEAQIIARRDGNQGAVGSFKLPRLGRKVLITLPLGPDTLVVPGSLRDRTLRGAEPYLEDR